MGYTLFYSHIFVLQICGLLADVYIPMALGLNAAVANASCVHDGLELAYPMNYADLVTFFARYEQIYQYTDCFWVGIYWNSTSRKHMWYDGKTEAVLWNSAWVPNEPDCITQTLTSPIFNSGICSNGNEECVVFDFGHKGPENMFRSEYCGKTNCYGLCVKRSLPSFTVSSTLSTVKSVATTRTTTSSINDIQPTATILSPGLSIHTGVSQPVVTTELSSTIYSSYSAVTGVSILVTTKQLSEFPTSQTEMPTHSSRYISTSVDALVPNTDSAIYSAETIQSAATFMISSLAPSTALLTTESSALVTAAPTTLITDWKGIAPITYHFVVGSFGHYNYSRASKLCAKNGMTLPIIKDESEWGHFRAYMDYLYQAVSSTASMGFWAGIKWNTKVQRHEWSDGISVTWALWEPGQPSCMSSYQTTAGVCSGDIRNCVVLIPSQNQPYASKNCSNKYSFICQKGESYVRSKVLRCKCPRRKLNTKWHYLDGARISELAVQETVIKDFKENVKRNISLAKDTLAELKLRRKISVQDNRPVAQGLGFVSVIVIVGSMALIVLQDVIKLLRYVTSKIK